jgi:hypothetical protein
MRRWFAILLHGGDSKWRVRRTVTHSIDYGNGDHEVIVDVEFELELNEDRQ